MTRLRPALRLPALMAGIVVLLSTLACEGRSTGDPNLTTDTTAATAARSAGAQPGSGGQGASTEPSGRTLAAVADFDREPCAVVSPTELRNALTEPFAVIAGNTLRSEGSPAAAGTGCTFRLTAAETDASETYHLVVVLVVRLASGGPDLMAACQRAASAQPQRYRTIQLGDGACVGPGAVLSIVMGKTYYSIDVTATPGRADNVDDDLRIGSLSVAVGTLVANRLPRT